MKGVFGRLAGAMLIVLLAMSCGGGGDAGGEATDSTESDTSDGNTYPATVVENCGGFTTEDAAEILEVAATDLEADTTSSQENNRTCTWTSSTEDSETLAFTLTHETSIEDAEAEMATLRENLGIAAEPAGEEGELPYEEIEDLGDEAVYSSVNTSTVVRVKNLTILVIGPEAQQEQVAVARQVIAKLEASG